jgi:hypothetical protein
MGGRDAKRAAHLLSGKVHSMRIYYTHTGINQKYYYENCAASLILGNLSSGEWRGCNYFAKYLFYPRCWWERFPRCSMLVISFLLPLSYLATVIFFGQVNLLELGLVAFNYCSSWRAFKQKMIILITPVQDFSQHFPECRAARRLAGKLSRNSVAFE